VGRGWGNVKNTIGKSGNLLERKNFSKRFTRIAGTKSAIKGGREGRDLDTVTLARTFE